MIGVPASGHACQKAKVGKSAWLPHSLEFHVTPISNSKHNKKLEDRTKGQLLAHCLPVGGTGVQCSLYKISIQLKTLKCWQTVGINLISH